MNIDTSLSIVPSVVAELGIKNEELISVAVARRERALSSAIHRANRELRDGQARLAESAKKVNAEAAAAVKEIFGERIKALEDAFAAFDIKGQVQTAVSNRREADGAVVWSVAVSAHRFGVLNSMAFSPTPNLVAATDEVARQEEEQKVKYTELLELKRELANIASTERQARAALAEATLAGTQAGRHLLAAMTGMTGLMEVPALGMTLNSEEK
jgi:hypothetical protein